MQHSPDTADIAGLATRLAVYGAAALAAIPVERRLEIWNDAIEALLDPESAERRALLLPLLASSGLSPEGLCEGLEVVLGGVRGEPARDLADSTVPVSDAGYAGVVLSGNLPGLAVQTMLPALVAGRPVLFKSASAEPHFAPALIRALADREPALADAFSAVSFPGEDGERFDAAFAAAVRVLAYGEAATLQSIARRLGDRLIAQGPKASVALVAGEADSFLVARKLARDIALFDQRGCLSVQAVYLSGPPAPFVEALAWALAIEHRRLPPGPPDASSLAAVQQVRGEAALRGLTCGDLPIGAGTVVVESDSRFRPSPGLRTVRVLPVERLADAVVALTPWTGRLQGAALAGEEAWNLVPRLEALGFSRFAQPGELQLAEAGWRNGGVDPRRLFD